MLRRLVIAFAISVLAAVLCWFVLPSLHVPIPWWVPLLAFVVIAAPTVLTAGPWQAPEPDEAPQPGDTDFNPDPDGSAADRRE